MGNVNRDIFNRPLLATAVASYVVYCLIGLAVNFLGTASLGADPPGPKGLLLLLTTRLWPTPMLESLGWPVNPQALSWWLIADAGGLILIVGLTLLFEWFLGPERRQNQRYLVPLLIGLAVALLVVEFAVVATIKISAA